MLDLLDWKEGREKVVTLDLVVETGDLVLPDNRDLTVNPENRESPGRADRLEPQARQVALELPEIAAKMV